MPGTEGANQPFFSPDSQWLGFQVRDQVRKVPVSGGAAATLTSGAPTGETGQGTSGIAWAGGSIVFASPTGLQQVADSGGTPQRLTRLNPGEGGSGHQQPAWVSDADAVFFTASTLNGPRVNVYSRNTGEQRNLIQGGSSPRYVPSGHLVYAQEGSLFAVALDAARHAIAGTPIPIVEGVMQTNLTAFYDIAPTGTLVYGSRTDAIRARRFCGWSTQIGVGVSHRGRATPGGGRA